MMRFSETLFIATCLAATLGLPALGHAQTNGEEPAPEAQQEGVVPASEKEASEEEPSEDAPRDDEASEETADADGVDEDTSEEPAEGEPPEEEGTEEVPPEQAETEPAAESAPEGEPAAESVADEPPAEEEAREHYTPLPDGMSVDDVLNVAAQPAPADFPRTIPDDRFYVFLLGEQLEYRAEDVDGSGHAGLEWQAWAGGDFNKIWLKTEAEAAFVDEVEFEGENDLLYSRLITPFWNLQLGAQYALGWAEDSYEDRWSAVLALQGMSPGSFEVDTSLYLSEAFDLTAVVSLEYDLRITQRLVLQPHAELGFSAQDVPERGLGIGLTDVKLDGRLRYEVRRDFAPYLGVRYSVATFGTADYIRDAGESPATFFVLAGIRFAI